MLQIVIHATSSFNKGTCVDADRLHEREMNAGAEMEAFPLWLKVRCAGLAEGGRSDLEELRALSRGPSRRVCSFKSMTSYGLHYRIEGAEGGGGNHVTFNCGVAELEDCREAENCSDEEGAVHIKRVGILKDMGGRLCETEHCGHGGIVGGKPHRKGTPTASRLPWLLDR